MRSVLVAVYYGIGLVSISSSVAGTGNVCNSSLLPSNASYTNKIYSEDSSVWLNPGRGFYHKLMTSSNVAEFDAIKESTLDCWRGRDGTTLLLRLYLLDDVSGAALSQSFLDNIRHDMTTVHKAGWNVVLRFMYNTDLDMTYNTQASEPTMETILGHVIQLKPIFHDFEGIIVAIQAGFLGELGLWYEPDVSGETAPPNTTYTQLFRALFQNVPASIPLQVPKPEYKQNFVSQTSTSYFDILTKSDKLRVGYFHECLLGGDTNHFINAFPRLNLGTLPNMTYVTVDTKYNIMGGRTCHPGDTNNQDLCADSLEMFEKIHMTYLDVEDPDETLKYYKHHNCFTGIHSRLGYQLFLHTVDLPTAANAGEYMCFHVSLVNKGFATPARNLDIFLVLELNTTVVYRVDLHLRKGSEKLWQPGRAEIPLVTKSVQLVSDMPLGQYKVYLALAEPKWLNDSNYYILLGGEYHGQPTANPITGFNYLGEVQILPPKAVSSSSQSSSSFALPSDSMQPWSAPMHTKHLRNWTAGSIPPSCTALPSDKPSTIVPPTTTPVIPTGVTHQFHRYVTCDSVEVTKALLKYTYFNSSMALPCPDTNPHSSESILQRFCQAPPASRWVPLYGVKVIDHCDDIAKFTPVAFFKSLLGVSVYDRGLNGGMAGVFFGCVEKDGVLKSVKIGIQLCGFPFDVALIHPGDVDLQSLYVVNLL
ncbi:uncharacterized protein LOC117343941 [Pecten maximus]|uniref:uncharacterized protein LOC117343941 n=1 Tax=Pecten maximus TaxID=6579 RepID=UPI001458FC29|nr:uncharacterized protein LOC117343941 [Pecten maximus]